MNAAQRIAHTKLAKAVLTSAELKIFSRLMKESTCHPSKTVMAPLELLVSFARLEAAGRIKSRFNEFGQPTYEFSTARRVRKGKAFPKKRGLYR